MVKRFQTLKKHYTEVIEEFYLFCDDTKYHIYVALFLIETIPPSSHHITNITASFEHMSFNYHSSYASNYIFTTEYSPLPNL